MQNLPAEVREAQEQKLEALKKQQDIHTRLAVERKIFLRDKKIKFFERRKIERRIRRLEKLQRASSSQSASPDQLASLKQDLQYVMVCLSVFSCHKNHTYACLDWHKYSSSLIELREPLMK